MTHPILREVCEKMLNIEEKLSVNLCAVGVCFRHPSKNLPFHTVKSFWLSSENKSLCICISSKWVFCFVKCRGLNLYLACSYCCGISQKLALHSFLRCSRHWCWMRDHCMIRYNIKQWFSSLSSAQQTAVVGSMCSIIIIKDEELMAVTCPWRSAEVLQSILIGRDMETRRMSALLILIGVKCHRS